MQELITQKSGGWVNSLVSNRNNHASNAECLTQSNFIVKETRGSRFAPGQTHVVTVGMYCPCCEYLGPEPEHWERFDCPACGLEMYAVGNMLFIWRSEFQTFKPKQIANPIRRLLGQC